jgi:hypothetical protein
MNFTIEVERNDEDIGNHLYTTITIIVKIDDCELVKAAYSPIKINETTFITCDGGNRITLEELNEFIENMEHEAHSRVIFNSLDGENSIVYSNGKIVFTNWYYECFLRVTLPLNQDTKNAFVVSFRRFFEEIREICNV